MLPQVRNDLYSNGLRVVVVCADGVGVCAAQDALREEIETFIGSGTFVSEERKTAVRNLLRKSGFKPSGRNKPASEYLVQAAVQKTFPFINNLVDCNNLVSLETGLPISMLNKGAVGSELRLRLGLPDERYRFNQSGQEIELEGLILACSASDQPLGNPIKDSMAGKLTEDTNSVVAIVYAPEELTAELPSVAQRFEELLRNYGNTGSVASGIF